MDFFCICILLACQCVLYLCMRCTHFICPSCVEPSPYAIASAVLLTFFISDIAKFTIWYMIILLKMLLHMSVDFYILY